ncbi:MAG: OmpH family outer membrane protein [Bacteroidetes bacterium]|jgi:outer membrane protein|nr:OmpH family outer membrane protein [Bacteroidota bacterium]
MKHLPILLASLGVFLASNLYAQKIGHVNLEKVVTALPEYKISMDSLQQEQKKIETRLQKMEAEYNRAKTVYADSMKLWPIAIRTIKQNSLALMEANFQQYYDLEIKRLDTMQQVVLGRMIKRVQAATKVVAKEQGISYVLNYNEQIVLYYEESHDITAAVKTKLGIK